MGAPSEPTKLGAVAGFGRQYRCDICGAVFEDLDQLMIHLKTHEAGSRADLED